MGLTYSHRPERSPEHDGFCLGWPAICIAFGACELLPTMRPFAQMHSHARKTSTPTELVFFHSRRLLVGLMHLPRNHKALHLCEDLSFLSPRFVGLMSVGTLCTTTFPPPGSCHMSSIPIYLLLVSNPSNKKLDIASGRTKFLAQMEPNDNIGSSLQVLSIYPPLPCSTLDGFLFLLLP